MSNSITEHDDRKLGFYADLRLWLGSSAEVRQMMMDLWLDEGGGEARRLWADLVAAAENGRGSLGPKTMITLLDEALSGDCGVQAETSARNALQALLTCYEEGCYEITAHVVLRPL